MRKSLVVLSMLAFSGLSFAQLSGQVSDKGAQGTISGVNIQGNTDIKASGENVNAVAVGKNNRAKNTIGGIKGGSNIQGNTKIHAHGKNVNAVAVGKGNKAENEIGVVGGGN